MAITQLEMPAEAPAAVASDPTPLASDSGATQPTYTQVRQSFVVETQSNVEITVPTDFELTVGSQLFGGVISNITTAVGNAYSSVDIMQGGGGFYQPTVTSFPLINNSTSAASWDCFNNYVTNVKKIILNNIRISNWGGYVDASVAGDYTTSLFLDSTATAATTCYWGNASGASFYISGRKTKEEEIRDRLRANLQPEIVTRNRNLWGISLTEEEIRARTLLLELIGETAFRRYLRRGFIMVQGRSGTLYKVSGGDVKIISYIKDASGKYVPNESFCVIFSYAKMPFTDGVIMRKLIIENDEFALRKRANVFKISDQEKAQFARVG